MAVGRGQSVGSLVWLLSAKGANGLLLRVTRWWTNRVPQMRLRNVTSTVVIVPRLRGYKMAGAGPLLAVAHSTLALRAGAVATGSTLGCGRGAVAFEVTLGSGAIPSSVGAMMACKSRMAVPRSRASRAVVGTVPSVRRMSLAVRPKKSTDAQHYMHRTSHNPHYFLF